VSWRRAWYPIIVVLWAVRCSLDESGSADSGAIEPDAAIDAAVPSDVGVVDGGFDAPPDDAAASDGAFTPSSISGLALWFRNDIGIVVDDAGLVSEWDDQSVGHVEATQANASTRPQFVLDGINHRPAVRFVATRLTSLLLSATPSLAAAHAFVVNQRLASPPPTTAATGFWRLSGNAGNGAVVPFVDNVVYDDFGSTVRHTTATLPISMATANVYEVVSALSLWSASVNGFQFFSTSANVVSFGGTSLVGANGSGNYYDGLWSEFVIYDHELSIVDRNALIAYFNNKYGLTSQ
jgi:hypothetical protein